MMPETEPTPAWDAPAISSEITRLITEHFAWTSDTPPETQARLREDLGLDSLHLVEFQVAIEDAFRVTFDPADEEFLDAFSTIGSLETYVRYLLKRGL
jgi:acyl carrier protein